MNIFKSKINESQEALENLQLEFDSLNEQFEVITNELKDAYEQMNTYKEEFERVDLENKELKTQLEAKQQEVEEKEEEIEQVEQEASEAIQEAVIDAEKVEEKAALKAVEIIADSGHPTPVQLLDEEEEVNTKPLSEQLKSLTGKELNEFFKANKEAIYKLLKK